MKTTNPFQIGTRQDLNIIEIDKIKYLIVWTVFIINIKAESNIGNSV